MSSLLLIFLGLFSFNNNNVDELTNYLNNKLKNYSKVVWEVSSLPKEITSLNDEKLIINKDAELKIKGDFIYLPVKIKRNSGKYVNSVVTLKVKLYKQVYTAIKVIQKGSLIDESDLMLLEVDVSGLRSEPITNFRDNKKYRAKVTIKDGTIIEANNVEELPLVLIGDVVKAIKNTGTVTISFMAKSKDEGKIGEIIRIQREDGKTFKAKIESKEIVTIVE